MYKRAPKVAWKIAILISAISVVFTLSAGTVVFAADPTDLKPNPYLDKTGCVLEAQPGETIPGSFSVNKCLKAPGQTSFVPDKVKVGEHSAAVEFASKVITIFLGVISSISLIVFILGALLTVTAEGKEDQLEKGKSAMIYAVIGLILALLSFVIVTFVQSILF